MDSQNTLPINKMLHKPIYSEDSEEKTYESFIPMISNFSTPKTDDSTCTRCVRKKFVCIIVFLIAIIACCQLLNTILSKISLNDVDNVSQLATKLFTTMFETKDNKSNYASTYEGNFSKNEIIG